MFRNSFLLTTSMLLMAFQTVHSEESASDAEMEKEFSASDSRQLVSMPEQTRKLMQEEMMGHLSTLNEIIGYLAANNFEAAADVAERKMGKSSMGKHRSTGMGPGKYMPPAMRNIGLSMHDAATEFSQVAKQEDLKSATSALQKVTSACVACHYSYRAQ
jgi:hypothetical protein